MICFNKTPLNCTVGGLYYCFGPMKLKFVDFMYFAVSIMTTVGYGDLDINLTKGDKWCVPRV